MHIEVLVVVALELLVCTEMTSILLVSQHLSHILGQIDQKHKTALSHLVFGS